MIQTAILVLLLLLVLFRLCAYWRRFKYLRWKLRAIPVLEREERRRKGLCIQCGYDLRATPDRCPECGTECGTAPTRKDAISS